MVRRLSQPGLEAYSYSLEFQKIASNYESFRSGLVLPFFILVSFFPAVCALFPLPARVRLL